ncbi:MAG: hypothetical protein ACLT8E_01380 [Akkermansia sp.]
MALLGRTRSVKDLQRKLAEEGLDRTLVLAADVLTKPLWNRPVPA